MYTFEACRICLKSDDDLMATTTKNSNGVSFNDLLAYCISDINWTTDAHPSFICISCSQVLQKLSEFKLAVVAAEIARKEHIQSSRQTKKIHKKTREKLPDYIDKENCYCKTCERKFSKFSTLLGHIRNIHTFEKKYPCDSCEAAFTNSCLLQRHQAKHKKERSYICCHCGKGFLTNSDLNHHVQRHQTIGKYCCNVCQKIFKTAANLASHKMAVHTKIEDRKYLCSACGQKCVTQTGFNVHMKRHLNVKEFGCEICEKKFVTRGELTRHVKAHSNLRLYICGVCGREYKNKCDLKGHLVGKHGGGGCETKKL